MPVSKSSRRVELILDEEDFMKLMRHHCNLPKDAHIMQFKIEGGAGTFHLSGTVREDVGDE